MIELSSFEWIYIEMIIGCLGFIYRFRQISCRWVQRRKNWWRTYVCVSLYIEFWKTCSNSILRQSKLLFCSLILYKNGNSSCLWYFYSMFITYLMVTDHHWGSILCVQQCNEKFLLIITSLLHDISGQSACLLYTSPSPRD